MIGGRAMLRRLFQAALLACALPAAALADVVADDCDWLVDMRNIAEPWEENTRTFYGGKLRVVLIDSIEPACCYMHLVLLMPNPDDPVGGRRCVAINQGHATGFGQIDFKDLTADYDPSTGLLVTFPYALFDPELSRMGPLRRATVRVNLSTGQVWTR